MKNEEAVMPSPLPVKSTSYLGSIIVAHDVLIENEDP